MPHPPVPTASVSTRAGRQQAWDCRPGQGCPEIVAGAFLLGTLVTRLQIRQGPCFFKVAIQLSFQRPQI